MNSDPSKHANAVASTQYRNPLAFTSQKHTNSPSCSSLQSFGLNQGNEADDVKKHYAPSIAVNRKGSVEYLSKVTSPELFQSEGDTSQKTIAFPRTIIQNPAYRPRLSQHHNNEHHGKFESAEFIHKQAV
jgi:hypothetical protein